MRGATRAGCSSGSRGCTPRARRHTCPYEEHCARSSWCTRAWCRRETLEGHTEKEIEEWRTEYDVIIDAAQGAGHEVRCLGVLDSLTELRSAIADWKPDIVFNLLEEFDGIGTYDQHVVAFLELLRQPYTGCNPRGLLLSRDKSAVQAAAVVPPHSHAAVRRVPPRRARARAARSCASRCS